MPADSVLDARIPDFLHPITIPTPFPVGPVHVYLLLGEPLTLLDTGPLTSEALPTLEAGLSQLGHRVRDLQQIVISHAHADHYGLAATLVERSGADVLAHGCCAARLSGQRERDGSLGWYRRLLSAAGVPALVQLRVAGGVWHVQRHSADVQVSRELAEGDTLRLGDRQWRVLHLPGHSPDLICLYQPDARLLLGSDHLIKHISSNAVIEPPQEKGAPRPRPLVDYWASLRRTQSMDIDLVLSGHGPPIDDHRALIERRFAFYNERLENIRGVLREGPRTVWEVVQALFPRLGGIDTFLAVSEVLGHLDVLEAQQEVRVHIGNRAWRYELMSAAS